MSYDGWKLYNLKDITINYDKNRIPLSTKVRLNIQGKYPYYGAQGIIDYINKYNFSGEYLLIAEDGANLDTRHEKIGRITKFDEKFWVNNHAHILKANEKADLKYIYYYLNMIDVSPYITGSAQPKLSQKNLNDIVVNLPNLSEQKAIAYILSTLDNKIEINTRINQNLEAMAQAIFKHWFVDFEFPNEEGKPYKSSGGEMVESEFGLIPKGWIIKNLSELINLLDSKRIPLSKNERSKMIKKYPYYGAASLMDYVDNYLFDGRYVLLGEDGTVVDKEGYPILQYVWGKFWVNNHAHVIKGKSNISEEFLLILLKNIKVQSIVTGAVQPKISQQNLKNLKFALPKDTILILRFSKAIESTYALYRKKFDENKKLTNLRDTLLPKLMSGEIRVPMEVAEQKN